MTKLTELRRSIDRLDSQLIQVLARRMKIMDKVADYKRQNKLAIHQPKREQELIKNRISKFKKLGFDDTLFVRRLYKLIIEKGKQIQRKRIK
ncbi:chorismate mutase [Candidatus Woesearchaeota archaeon]|nr:chorismate mutase [Candidatus Woesearchaeota archaeon]